MEQSPAISSDCYWRPHKTLSLPHFLPMICHLSSVLPSSTAKHPLLMPSMIPGMPRALLCSWQPRGCNSLEVPIAQMREWHSDKLSVMGCWTAFPQSIFLVVSMQISKWHSFRGTRWNLPRWWMNPSLSAISGNVRSPRWLTLTYTVETPFLSMV